MAKIGASPCKVHLHAAGPKGGNQDMSHTKGDSTQKCIWPWMHIMPVRALVTQGTTADCTQAITLIEDFSAEYLSADRGDDSDVILCHAKKTG